MARPPKEKNGQEEQISSIGKALKAWRLKNGHSQEYVKGCLGKSQSLVTLIELGQRRPELNLVVEIARLIGIDPRKAVLQHMREDDSTMLAADVLSRRSRGGHVTDEADKSPVLELFESLPAKERKLIVELMRMLSRPTSGLIFKNASGNTTDDIPF
ncbi:MAG: helix-turn-helix transcriptional regulator [Acidobacteria bacterium]|nr:helix-turn-helix transcriptional regulator [Acidobacteriota bacterium]